MENLEVVWMNGEEEVVGKTSTRKEDKSADLVTLNLKRTRSLIFEGSVY